MGKDWDKAVPHVAIWKECLRLLKPGAFAFVMSAPRQDVLSRMIVNLQDAGFDTGFTSIYWAYASGFPKATNVGKTIDKANGIKRDVLEVRKVTENMAQMSKDSPNKAGYPKQPRPKDNYWTGEILSDEPVSEDAKLLNGSYAGFQPKPAVEIIIVAMKPLQKKTFVAQAMDNFKGITWLDDCRIPFKQGDGEWHSTAGKGTKGQPDKGTTGIYGYFGGNADPKDNVRYDSIGRFPANLLVSDDVLNDGIERQSGKAFIGQGNDVDYDNVYGKYNQHRITSNYADCGSFSRYFNLDKWWEEKVKSLPESVQEVYPFLICPKASKSEKNIGCEELEESIGGGMQGTQDQSLLTGSGNIRNNLHKNNHPTVKPLKLMSYLVTLGSRPNDTILDPFIGSGTTARACKTLNRKCIGFEIDTDQYVNIASHRQDKVQLNMLGG